MINVLIACEESQRVCLAFRRRGFNAFSCDILPCSGGAPDCHIQDNVLSVMNGNGYFITQDNILHKVEKWDAVIAFPPYTHLASSGARWFKEKQKSGVQQTAIDFFMQFALYPCKYKAIENPVGIMSNIYRKPDQIIQPYMFGHGELKTTCLWLFGLPKLSPTNIVEGREQRIWKMPPSPQRAKERSKTYPGVAEAMAEQWGNFLWSEVLQNDSTS